MLIFDDRRHIFDSRATIKYDNAREEVVLLIVVEFMELFGDCADEFRFGLGERIVR